MRSEQRAAASSSTSGWLAKVFERWGVGGWSRCCAGNSPARPGESPEVPQEQGRLTVAYRLEREELANALPSGGGHPVQQLGPQLCMGIRLRRRGDDVLHLCGLPVAQLGDDVVELRSFVADACQSELCLHLGEPHGWPLSPERLKPYGHSGYLRWLRSVRCLHFRWGPPVWDHTDCFCRPLKGAILYRNGCGAALSQGRPPFSGRNENRLPDVTPPAMVVRALSESAGARVLAAFGRRPDRAGGHCVNALGVVWR
jgi:hypothetical protein